MRLTLRTLLAYRDRVLNTGDWEGLHSRVQQSAMAGNLLKRMDELGNRPTILAPPIEGKGLGADANTIAEYLDDALGGEKVPELERICLESDVQLAELVQCHHLLTTALSTSVEVPPRLKQRIAGLADPVVRRQALLERPTGIALKKARKGDTPIVKLDGPTPVAKPMHSSDSQPVEVPMVASGGTSIRPTGLDLEGSQMAHEVPEYLRGRSRDGWRGPLAIGALLAVLALLVWQSIGPWENFQRMFASRDVSNGASVHVDDNQVDKHVNNNDASNSRASDSVEGIDRSSIDSSPSIDSPPLESASNRPKKEDAAPDAAPANNKTIDGTRPAAVPTPNYAVQWLPADAASMQAVVFAQINRAQPMRRLEPAEGLPSGAQVIVPPANRPTLDIGMGPRWICCGPTQMSVALPDSGDALTPQIEFRLGRALLKTDVNNDRQRSLLISAAASQLRITLMDASSSVAIETKYESIVKEHGPVTDRSFVAPVLGLHSIEGQISIQLLGKTEQSSTNLAVGQSIWIRDGISTPAVASPPPAWVDPASDRAVDIVAAGDIHRLLNGKEPVDSTLMKLATNRRPETRALAAQSLAMIGRWDWVPLEKNSLADKRDRSYWGPLLDLTRQLLAANPEDAAKLSAILGSHDPQRGPLRTLLWIGPTQAQLEKDLLKTIVDILDSEAILDRILAINQLQRLTGKDFGYEAGEPKRASIQQWNRELVTNRLQFLPANQGDK